MLKLIFTFFFSIFLGMNFFATPCLAADGSKIVIVELNGEIDHGQAALVLRGIKKAEEENARAFILQMDTFGGLVAAATNIRDKIIDSKVPTICYIKNRAWSAGALIALAHKDIVIAPGGSIGAAEPIPTTEKSIAAVKAEFAATANRTGRDPTIAEAMVDKTLGYKEYAKAGQILALTDYQAVEVKYADFVADDRKQLLEKMGLENAPVEVLTQNWQENLIGILENPAVRSLLLTIIIISIVTEIKTGGIGIGAAVAVIAAGLLYGGTFLGGMSDWLAPSLFFFGAVLLVVELIIPGFGIFGVAGILSIVASFFFILGGDMQAVSWLAGSIALSIILLFVLLQKLPSSSLWNRFVLKDTLSKQEGYSSGPDYETYLGKEGLATTQLRPGGVAEFDGKKLDVLTYGEFVEPGTKITVIKTEGNKLFVKPKNL